MELTLTDLLTRLGCALFCGMLIGVERQWHQRQAGLRTYTLVACGAALFVAVATAVSSDASAVGRITGQIITGVGFLGAGVIMKNNNSSSLVQGINTAATIWCSSAIGTLAGAGLFRFAGAGTAAVLFVNVLLRPIVEHINRQPARELVIVTEYTFHVKCDSDQEAAIRTALVNLLPSPFYLLKMESGRESGRACITTIVGANQRDDLAIEQACAKLATANGVKSVDWHASNPNSHV